MDCKPVTSHEREHPEEGIGRAWFVTVECDDGSTHQVEVLLAEVALPEPSELVNAILQSDGASVIVDALASDPTRVPTRITCSTEGAQPEYPN